MLNGEDQIDVNLHLISPQLLQRNPLNTIEPIEKILNEEQEK